MKKPINKFAVAMWVAAVIVAFINVTQIYMTLRGLSFSHSQGQEAFFMARSFLIALTDTIAPVLLLVGFGALLEMVDQIRWDAKNRN